MMIKALHKSLNNAINMMKESGFKIDRHIEVEVDRNLPFLGHTIKKEDGYLIVVSGKFMKSGLLEGLFVHELSHVYRKETNHPSHNRNLLDKIVHSVVHKHRITERYHEMVLHHIVRYIQDLYASDISFEIFKKDQNKLPLDVMVNYFFHRWMKSKPVKLSDSVKEKWINADIMLKNSLVISSMMRHEIENIDNILETNKKLLSLMDTSISREFLYFKKFMANLKEDITERSFKIQLTKYLEKFLSTVK